MQRFSVSVDDDLADWIEAKAEERGVSKAKVIRDAIETASVTGLVKRDESMAEGSALVERVDELEARVTALEGRQGEGQEDSESDGSSGIVEAFEKQLADRPPTTAHGKRAVVRIFSLLLEEGPMQTSELREAVYPVVEEEFASAESMWQSVQRYLDDLPGIEHAGYGEWDAAPSDVVDSDEPTQ